MFSRISVAPNVYHGQACIKGTRIPVHQIVQMLANGSKSTSLSKINKKHGKTLEKLAK